MCWVLAGAAGLGLVGAWGLGLGLWGFGVWGWLAGGWLDWALLGGAVWLGRCCNFAFPQESLAGEVRRVWKKGPDQLVCSKAVVLFYMGVL